MPDITSLIVNPPHERNIFTNRTLNMQSIQLLGYDMDYTLIYYDVKRLEKMAYEHVKEKLLELGWPIEHLNYDPEMMIRGLVIDRKLGNIVKPNRFGYIKRAYHGTLPMDYKGMRQAYSRTLVDIRQSRWVLLNTLFDLSVGCLYAQLVDHLDCLKLPEVLGYADLQEKISRRLDLAYAKGLLKDEILKDPDTYIVKDAETPLALLDQKYAGKALVLITDSDWGYVREIMSYTFDRHLPDAMNWRELFDMIIVSAGKPNFFLQKQPAFEVVDEEGLLKPVFESLQRGRIYVGGHAGMVEDAFGMDGSEIMYVGDHIESDVHASKSILRWRTALVLPELEEELACLDQFRSEQSDLFRIMKEKVTLENQMIRIKIYAQRATFGYGPQSDMPISALYEKMDELAEKMSALDKRIKPLAIKAWKIFNPHWGLISRSGWDKSYLSRLLEGHADIYMSRVSNFLYRTPFAFLRSSRSSLPHDDELIEGPRRWETED
ncbi:MAG: HAD-IG family 5'-nucleotidase [Desulfobacterales bacterium]|nr:MAG: HAD-IG family 5'-nucleotidase [Desulfobacterales bacterium]